MNTVPLGYPHLPDTRGLCASCSRKNKSVPAVYYVSGLFGPRMRSKMLCGRHALWYIRRCQAVLLKRKLSGATHVEMPMPYRFIVISKGILSPEHKKRLISILD